MAEMLKCGLILKHHVSFQLHLSEYVNQNVKGEPLSFNGPIYDMSYVMQE